MLAKRSDAKQSLGYRAETGAQFFADIADALIALSHEKPVLLIFDGLHWLDPLSSDLLTSLLYSLGNANDYRNLPIMVAGTMRTSAGSDRTRAKLESLDREVWSADLQLSAFDEAETQALIASRGLPHPSRQLADRLCHAAVGNPGLIIHILERLQRSGDILLHSGYSLLREPTYLKSWEAEPVSGLDENIERLDARGLDIIAIAALLGRRFDLDDLASVTGVNEPSLMERLADVSAMIQLRQGAYHFVNEATHRAFLNRTPASQRVSKHLEIAETLERTMKDQSFDTLWRIFNQYLQARPAAPPSKLYSYGKRVGELASQVYAWDTAASAYLAASQAVADEALRAEMHENAGTCYRYSWDTGPAIYQFEQAHLAWKACGRTTKAAEALAQKTRLVVREFAPGQGVDLTPFEMALDMVGEDDPALRAYILTRLCDAYSHSHRGPEAVSAGLSAREIAVAQADDWLTNDACTFLGLAYQLSGQLDASIENYNEAIARAERLKRPWLQNIPRQRLTMAQIMQGRLADARASAEAGLRIAEATNYPGEACMADANLTAIAAIAGDFDAVERHAGEMQSLFVQSRYSIAAFQALRALAAARCYQGDRKGAIDAIDQLAEPGRVFERPERRVRDLVVLMRHYIQRNAEPGRANAGVDRAEAQEAVANFFSRHLDGDVNAYNLCEVCQIAELAEDLRMVELYPALNEKLNWALERNIQVAFGWPLLVKRVLASLHRANGNHAKAEDLMREAIAETARIGAGFEAARSAFELARILAAKHDMTAQIEAQGYVRQACEGFRAARAPAFLARAANLAENLGLHLNSAAGPVAAGALSERKRRIMDHMARGRTETEISRDMMLSRQTIADEADEIASDLGIETGGEDAPLHLTLMVTDIEKSTPLIERLGDRAAYGLFREHDEIVRRALVNYGGVEIKNRGDGILSGFHSCLEALGCARTIQQELDRRDRGSEFPLRVRVGLHAGGLILREDGLFGLNIHIAVRICDYCQPGEIVFSEGVCDFAQKFDLPHAYIGQVDLKGLSRPTRLYSLNWRTPLSGTESRL